MVTLTTPPPLPRMRYRGSTLRTLPQTPLMTRRRHYVVTRYAHGWGSRTRQAPDRIEVMAASRTLRGAQRLARALGTYEAIEERDGPYRRYARNELLRYARQ